MLYELTPYLIMGLGWIFFFPHIATDRFTENEKWANSIGKWIVRAIALSISLLLAYLVSKRNEDLIVIGVYVFPGIHYFVVKYMLNEDA